MVLADPEYVELQIPFGPMRTHIARPAAPGRYPGVLFFSEIFQRTPPIARTAALIAGHGYVVATPEIYHEFLEPGAVLAYDQAGSDLGNHWKYEKELVSYDADARAVADHLRSRPDCTGVLGAAGICLGGHLAFRAAFLSEVRATACFYATDLHKGSLGKGMQDDSLQRAEEIRGELLMVWGRQDPHVPLEGRRKILERLDALNLRFCWHEVNGAHAFLRDEGPRYDPELAMHLYREVLDLFQRRLGEGDR